MTTEAEPLNVRVFKLMYPKIATRKYNPAFGGNGVLYRRVDSLGKDLPAPLSWEYKSPEETEKVFPLIHENFQLTLDWLVPHMRDAGYEFEITLEWYCQDDDSYLPERWFVWHYQIEGYKNSGELVMIKDDKVARAACLAAIPILEKIKKEGK